MGWQCYIRISCLAFVLVKCTVFAAASSFMNHEVEELVPQPRRQIVEKSRRQDGGVVVVTGAQGFGIQPRLEIRELQQNADQWNLFLLGLTRFQAVDQTDKQSYYEICAIHGRPYRAWDGVQAGPGAGEPGYCAHSNIIFCSWHRPYLALYEQLMQDHMIDAANEFPAGNVRDGYIAAAHSWRHPYWDWAALPASGSVWPDSVSTETVLVTTPNGTEIIHNPLLSYLFHDVSMQDFSLTPFGQWGDTKRDPTSWDLDATSQNNLVGEILDKNRQSMQDRLYNLFTSYNNFTQFGTEAWFDDNTPNADSLESLHGVIHGITGSDGHMTYLDFSAYDPIFWLHHFMVDRCFAMWQELYPNSYVEPMEASQSTFAYAAGTILDTNSPLAPFHANAAGDMWTSESARSTETFGSTYTDLANGSVDTLKTNINKLYGNSTGFDTKQKRGDVNDGLQASGSISGEPAPDDKHYEYIANIRSTRHGLNGSYAIYMFMGDFDDDPSCWQLAPNLTGTHGVAARLQVPGAMNGHAVSNTKITAAIPLTSKLVEKVQRGELQSMDTGIVEEYLTQKLAWRVGKFDGSRVPTEDVPELTITVVSAEIQLASCEHEFPQWGTFTELTNITQGKPGGCA